MLLANFTAKLTKIIEFFPSSVRGGTQETITTEVGADATLL